MRSSKIRASKAAVNRRTPDAPRNLGAQRVSRQRVECGASAPLSKGFRRCAP